MSVYFIRPISMAGPIKIGTSCRPEARVLALDKWSPFPLEVVAVLEGDHRLEMRFHARFLADHVKYEWFNWSPELQAVIDAICAGAFDTASLPEPKRLPRSRPIYVPHAAPTQQAAA